MMFISGGASMKFCIQLKYNIISKQPRSSPAIRAHNPLRHYDINNVTRSVSIPCYYDDIPSLKYLRVIYDVPLYTAIRQDIASSGLGCIYIISTVLQGMGKELEIMETIKIKKLEYLGHIMPNNKYELHRYHTRQDPR